MNQNDAPAYTLATLGHPSNHNIIIKTEAGPWMYLVGIRRGQTVNDEDFRSGWDMYIPEGLPVKDVPFMEQVFGPSKTSQLTPEQELKMQCLDRARKDLPRGAAGAVTARARDYEFYVS